MGEGTPSPVFEDIFSKCLLCGACVKACPRDVDITAEVREARSGFTEFYGEYGYRKALARKVLEHPELLSVIRTLGRSFVNLAGKTLPKESGLRLQLALLGHELPEGDVPVSTRTIPAGKMENLIYFPGCSATHLYPEITDSCHSLFNSLGYNLVIPEGLVCCGLAIDSAGDLERSRVLARKNILALERHAGPIMVSCGSCYAHLRRYREVLADDPAWKDRVDYVCERLVELSQLLDKNIPESGPVDEKLIADSKIRIFYHDPCHLRNELNITREPRNLLGRFNAVELVELEDGPQCCGQGGLFHLGAPELSAIIRDDLACRVLALQPDIITTGCSGCMMQWKSALAAADKKLPVLHLVELLARLQDGTLSG
jgi:glycolate oxidase iron-sulfur subunit